MRWCAVTRAGCMPYGQSTHAVELDGHSGQMIWVPCSWYVVAVSLPVRVTTNVCKPTQLAAMLS
jgi:hypothetical protein